MRRRERLQRRVFLRGYAAGRQLTDHQTARLEQKLADQMSEQRAFLLQVIVEQLDNHRREVVAGIRDTFGRLQKQVRELQLQGDDSSQLIDLLPPGSTTLQ
jgi:hypothetical protein